MARDNKRRDQLLAAGEHQGVDGEREGFFDKTDKENKAFRYIL